MPEHANHLTTGAGFLATAAMLYGNGESAF